MRPAMVAGAAKMFHTARKQTCNLQKAAADENILTVVHSINTIAEYAQISSGTLQQLSYRNLYPRKSHDWLQYATNSSIIDFGGPMAILHVRNVPQDLYDQIRRQAQEENRSLSAQVVFLLERAILESPQAQGEVLQNIRRRRTFRPEKNEAPDSLSLLRQDRNR